MLSGNPANTWKPGGADTTEVIAAATIRVSWNVEVNAEDDYSGSAYVIARDPAVWAVVPGDTF